MIFCGWISGEIYTGYVVLFLAGLQLQVLVTQELLLERHCVTLDQIFHDLVLADIGLLGHSPDILEILNMIVWINSEHLAIDLLVFIRTLHHRPPYIIVVIISHILDRQPKMFHKQFRPEIVSKLLYFPLGLDGNALQIAFSVNLDFG